MYKHMYIKNTDTSGVDRPPSQSTWFMLTQIPSFQKPKFCICNRKQKFPKQKYKYPMFTTLSRLMVPFLLKTQLKLNKSK